jgi:hypothetical protein
VHEQLSTMRLDSRPERIAGRGHPTKACTGSGSRTRVTTAICFAEARYHASRELVAGRPRNQVTTVKIPRRQRVRRVP